MKAYVLHEINDIRLEEVDMPVKMLESAVRTFPEYIRQVRMLSLLFQGMNLQEQFTNVVTKTEIF